MRLPSGLQQSALAPIEAPVAAGTHGSGRNGYYDTRINSYYDPARNGASPSSGRSDLDQDQVNFNAPMPQNLENGAAGGRTSEIGERGGEARRGGGVAGEQVGAGNGTPPPRASKLAESIAASESAR